mgnify:CR=1 FL=1
MSNLKNVRAELEKMKKEMAAKEAELKREEARPVIELINNELLNSDAVQEKMSAYSKDEARVIAKHIDAIISESQGEINELRAKKKERAEKRKAAKLDRELEKWQRKMTMKMTACTVRISSRNQTHTKQDSCSNACEQL